MKRTIPAVALILAAAASAGAPAPPPAAAAYRRGLVRRAGRDYDAALREFRAAIAASPSFIDAHREYQNLMIDFGLQEQLVREYGAAAGREPGRAEAHYLYGRVLDDPSHQEREFDRAVALDPLLPWGHYGRAMLLLSAGDCGGAEREIASALAADPSMIQALVGRALLEALAGRHARALEIYRAILERDDASAEVFGAALAECHLLERIEEGGEIGARAVARFPGNPALMSYRGYFLARGGDDRAAIGWYERAAAAGPLPFVFARDLRGLYASAGEDEKAAALWRSLFGAQLAAPDSLLAPLWRDVEQTACAPHGSDRLAAAYERMGWWNEAAAAREAAGEREAARVEDDRREARIVRGLERFGRWLDGETPDGAPRVSFARAVEELARETERAAGTPLVEPGGIRSRPGVRWFGGARGRPQPLIDRVRRGNREMILFENVFAHRIGFELGELLRCSLVPGADDGPPHWEIVCCPSGSGVMEGESGLLYPPFTTFAIFYEPARWSSLLEESRMQKRDPLEHAWFLEETGDGPLGPRDVVYSRMLEKRLFEKVRRALPVRDGAPPESALEDLSAGLVAEHERRHLEDIRLFLPAWRHPLRCLAVAAGSGFSPRRIEARFEERAAARSLAGGGEPFLALLAIHSQLAGSEGAHRDACRRVLQALADSVAARPGDFPRIDCSRNILNQLYLLDGEAIRGIARGAYGGDS